MRVRGGYMGIGELGVQWGDLWGAIGGGGGAAGFRGV